MENVDLKTKSNGVVLFPTQIELGSYAQGNKRKIKFNKDNQKHIKMFEKFYGVKVNNYGSF
jgi:hypothetical protein